MLANTNTKVGKLNPWQWCKKRDWVSQKSDVLFYNKTDRFVWASNGAVLLQSKTLYKEFDESKISKNGEKEGWFVTKGGTFIQGYEYGPVRLILPNDCKEIGHLSREETEKCLKAVKSSAKLKGIPVSQCLIKFSEDYFLLPYCLELMLTLPGEWKFDIKGGILHYDDGDNMALIPNCSIKGDIKYQVQDNIYIPE